MLKKFFWFIVGWFISIFATHNFGWEQTIKCGWILSGMCIFFAIIFGIIEKWKNGIYKNK